MTHNHTPSQAQLIKQTLDAHRKQEYDLFSEYNTNPYFWKLSELTILFPKIFDIKKPISQKVACTIKSMVTDSIPEFKQLQKQPIHIMNVKETVNFFDSAKKQIRTVKHATNQNLTNVACEYLFRQFDGKEIEQAYFLYPDRPAPELAEAAQSLRFEKIRDQIARTSNLLSAIINRAHGADKNSFRNIWSLMWETLYKVKTMDILRERHNIKTSPIDYMKPQTLIFINTTLQEIVFKFANQPFYTIADVRNQVFAMATMARAKFIKYGSTPEQQLTEKSTYSIVEKVRNARKRFWQHNYPKSLMER